MEKILVTIPEACEALGHGRSYIYELIAAGKIEAKKSGKRTLITTTSVRRYAESLPPLKAAS